jgi:CTP:molybdopterin cytidylyltransferase MocA
MPRRGSVSVGRVADEQPAPPPARQPSTCPPAAGLLLAAGAGRRYGMPKALVERDGQRLVERAARVLADGGCDPVVVVVGAAADRVRPLAGLSGCRLVDNPDWSTGMGSSLRAGLATLSTTAAMAVVVLLVDMPGITPEAVRRVAGYASADALVMGGYGGRRGHPVLLGRNHWRAIAARADGDAGARGYLREHTGHVLVVPCADVADDRDLDVPDKPA